MRVDVVGKRAEAAFDRVEGDPEIALTQFARPRLQTGFRVHPVDHDRKDLK